MTAPEYPTPPAGTDTEPADFVVKISAELRIGREYLNVIGQALMDAPLARLLAAAHFECDQALVDLARELGAPGFVVTVTNESHGGVASTAYPAPAEPAPEA